MSTVVRLFFSRQFKALVFTACLCAITNVKTHAQAFWPALAGSLQQAVAKAQAEGQAADEPHTCVDDSELEEPPANILTPALPSPWLRVNVKDFAPRNEADDKPRNHDKPAAPPVATEPNGQFGEKGKFQWRSAWRQSLAFLGIQHAFRMATEAGSRADLKGPFFKDYFKTLGELAAWDDGDPFIVNYIGHPMMGSVTGYIQIQNDPKGIHQEVGLSKAYWKSRLKAFGWSFVYSTQFELGPLSEASFGNVGIRPYEGHKHPMAYVDVVVTPVLGTAWLVGEDTMDRYLIRHLENKTRNRAAVALVRGFLNPTRSFANLLRGKWPWYRDDRR
jgi:hypothetical protein